MDDIIAAKPGSSFYGDNGRQHLIHLISDFLIAGSETSSTALIWIFLYLAKYPKVQEKLQVELKKAYGTKYPGELVKCFKIQH